MHIDNWRKWQTPSMENEEGESRGNKEEDQNVRRKWSKKLFRHIEGGKIIENGRRKEEEVEQQQQIKATEKTKSIVMRQKEKR